MLAVPATTAPAVISVPPAATPSRFSTSAAVSSGPPAGIFPGTIPKNGQTADEQARDHYECYRFATAQSGYDPMHSSGSVTAAQTPEAQSAFERLQKACLEGRNYAIR
jgi:hypothetical protein